MPRRAAGRRTPQTFSLCRPSTFFQPEIAMSLLNAVETRVELWRELAGSGTP